MMHGVRLHVVGSTEADGGVGREASLHSGYPGRDASELQKKTDEEIVAGLEGV
jgi:hypothetical protein